MNKWARRRKRIILAIVFFFVVVIIGIPAFLLFYRAPTCFDGRMNGDEGGVDCGGSCQLLCSAESLPLLLDGDPRVLPISENTYQVVALIENSNNDAEIYRAGYIIKLYDGTNVVPMKVIEGETYIPRGSRFALFEGPLTVEEGTLPHKATLEWREDTIVWKKNVQVAPELTVTKQTFSRLETTPRLEAEITNPSLETVSNIDLVAIVSDAEGNLFAASKTFIDSLNAGERTKVIFTWPAPFNKEPVGIEIITRVFPDRSFIR